MDSELPTTSFKLSEPHRILVRGVNWLGDAVMSTPALQRLRERFPLAHLALLTADKLADLWVRHPCVDEIIPFAAGSSPWRVARKLRAARTANSIPGPQGRAANRAAPFELALVFPNSPRSAFEVWLAGIPRRVGYARPWRNWLLTQCVQEERGHARMSRLFAGQVRQLVRTPPTMTHPLSAITAGSHQIHGYLHLTAALGADPTPVAPKLEVAPEELLAANQRLAGLSQNTSPAPLWLGLVPSAAYGPAKRWPADCFAVAARDVSRQVPNAVWVLFGAETDRPLCARIAGQAKCPIVDLTGATSLRQLMATLKLCRVLLTNDSGPMHLAAAVGTSVVALFGSTAPGLTGPGLPGDPRHRILRAAAPCAPCFRRDCPIDLRCLTGITPEQVVNAVLESVSHPVPASS